MIALLRYDAGKTLQFHHFSRMPQENLVTDQSDDSFLVQKQDSCADEEHAMKDGTF